MNGPISTLDTLINSHSTLDTDRKVLLVEILQHLRSGTRKTLFIKGPEGIGKTTFLNCVKRELESEKYFIVSSGHQTSFKELLQSMAQQLDIDNFVPASQSNISALEELVTSRLNMVSKKMPVLILFDDVHALPLQVLNALINFIAVHFSPESKLYNDVRLLAFADTGINPKIQEYISAGSFDCYVLRRISHESLSTYLHQAFPNSQFSDAELNRIFTASDGIPGRINHQATIELKQRARQNLQIKRITQQSVDTLINTTPILAQPSQATAKALSIKLFGRQWLSSGQQTVLASALAITMVFLGYNTLDVNNTNAYETIKPIMAEVLQPSVDDDKCLAEDECETEYAQEFVEFSDHLSSDEIELLALEPDEYVIQFLAGASEQDAEDFAESYSELGVKIYRSLLNGEPWYKAIITGFANPTSAMRIAEYLPEELQTEKPFVRTVASVQEEIVSMGEQQLNKQMQSYSFTR